MRVRHGRPRSGLLRSQRLMYTDAHAHLGELDSAELAAVLERARVAGVHAILNTATSPATSRAVLAQCLDAPGLLAAVGISPFDAGSLGTEWRDELAELAHAPGVCAIGETGLDSTNPRYPSLDLQVPLFEAHAALARELNLPLVVHSRGCEREVVTRSRKLALERVVFHCFTGTIDDMREIVDAGYTISLSGIVTFRAASLDAVAVAVPLDCLLVETDSPYLAPVPHRGTRNEPSYVPLVARHIAALRGMRPSEFAAAVGATFDGLFRTPERR